MRPLHKSGYHKRRLIAIAVAIEVLVMACLFGFSALQIRRHLESDIQSNMLAVARYASQHIYAKGLRLIHDENDFFFTEIRRQLEQIEAIYQLRKGLVYVIELHDGQPLFSVMTSPNSFRGEAYPEEITAQIMPVFQGRETITGLYRDRNGSFISVLVPLWDEGEVVAALEMDFPGEVYQKKLYARVIPFFTGLIVLLVMGFLVTLVLLLRLFNAREQELNQTHLQMVQAEKMALLSRVVAGIFHEINNPLGAISSAVDISGRCLDRISEVVNQSSGNQALKYNKSFRKLFSTLRDNHVVISFAGSRISTLVKSLKNFARVDEADFKKVNINEAIENTLAVMNHELHEGIEVRREYGDIPEIYAYPVQVNQMFMNLILNAAQAIESQGEITIRTRSGDDAVVIEIADTGKGIKSEAMRHLFEPRFTAKKTRVGLGIGLSHVYWVVQNHRGQISIRSEVGRGTQILLSLPINLTDQRQQAAAGVAVG